MSSADAGAGPKLEFRGEALLLAGPLVRDSLPALEATLRRIARRAARARLLRIELAGVQRIDTAGAAFLAELSDRLGGVPMVGASAQVAAAVEALGQALRGPAPPASRESPLVRLGTRVHASWVALRETLQLAADMFAGALTALVDPSGHRRGAVVEQAVRIGLEAVGVVGLLSFIIGVILALQAAAQLRMFGANIFVADLVAVAMVREMGPMMMAVLVAGRSGSAMAAEIATMSVSEEIDALRTMAVDPIRYVAVPKLLAITLCAPVLVTLSTLIGIGGGLLVAVVYLELPVVAFVDEAIEILRPADILNGLAKSVVFAWLIAVISSRCGLRASGGAEGVGRETTRSVVASIFAVIVADVLFSLAYLP